MYIYIFIFIYFVNPEGKCLKNCDVVGHGTWPLTGSINRGLYGGYEADIILHGPRGAHGNGFIHSCNIKFIVCVVLSLRFKYCLFSFL